MGFPAFHVFEAFALAILLASACLLHKANAYKVVVAAHGQRARKEGCDLFQGSWVYDGRYQPPYDATACPFIEDEFNCQKNGRPDSLYLKYKWKPSACELPRFDGEDFVRRMKGKKILFVGDSLSLNQWQSLICMLHASLPNTSYSLSRQGDVSAFIILEHDISVKFSRNAFLVDIVTEKTGRILKLDSITNGDSWKGYDMLIFNTWHWWTHKGRKQPWDYVQLGKTVQRDMDRLVAFKEGLTTWSKWVDANVDPTTTSVLYQGTSPTHYDGTEWNESKTTTCLNQTEPVKGSVYPAGLPPPVAVVKDVLSRMSKPVTLLDITTLSQLRKDGHPSIYGFDGKRGNDCSHWCLGGVPDTWNELLYAILVNRSEGEVRR